MKMIKNTLPAIFVSNITGFSDYHKNDLFREAGISKIEFHSEFAISDRPILSIRNDNNLYSFRLLFPRSIFDQAAAKSFLNKCKKACLELETNQI